MTIRYECEQCGSTLKIKDDLAGKPGKCPKCKTAFTIPAAGESLTDSEPEITAPKAVARKPAAAANDDFDVDEFLMSESRSDTGKKSKPKSKAVTADFNEDDFLADEPASKGSGKSPKSTSQDADDDEVFQIRRPDGGEAKTPKRSLGIEEESTPASSTRRPPGTSSAGTASNIASDLLAKTGKRGKKTAWNEVEPESKESEYDYTDLKNYLLKKVAPLLFGGIIGISLLFYVTSSMMGGNSNLPDLGQVTGTVTLGGKPVSGVIVGFHPPKPAQVPVEQKDEKDKKKEKKQPSSSFGMTDEAGHYELTYVKDVPGAGIGECRVEIQAPSRTDIPPKWVGMKSTETRKVELGKQIIDLELAK